MSDTNIVSAEVVLPGKAMNETVAFFLDLGFRVDAIFPADDPQTASLSGHGLRLRLQANAEVPPGVLQLACTDPAAFGPSERVAPNGTRVRFVGAQHSLVLPDHTPALTVSHAADAEWIEGRAGMHYRDLIPEREGGRVIASHIRIEAGGPVPDYVHYHVVRFQMIYCYRGWVRVVYEDQGAPFVLQAGDCVLQPPQIRHRVLESSPGLEVVELGCPADHQTRTDPGLELPNAAHNPEREFDGQVFIRHVAEGAAWQPWRAPGFECRNIGLDSATRELADARVIRPCDETSAELTHDDAFAFTFVLDGHAQLEGETLDARKLGAGDSFVVPRGVPHHIRAASADLQLLQVRLPTAGDRA